MKIKSIHHIFIDVPIINMNNKILSTNSELFEKITPDTFSYVKLYVDTDNPEYYLINTILTDEWLDELKIFNDISSDLQPEKYNGRSIINYIRCDLSEAFKILYLQLLTSKIPVFGSLDRQLEYLIILNKMVSKNKIEIIMHGLLLDNKVWSKIVNLDLNFKNFLPDYYKLNACHYCLCNPDTIASRSEHDIIDLFGLKYITNLSKNSHLIRIQDDLTTISMDDYNYRIYDQDNKIIYQVIGIGPLIERVISVDEKIESHKNIRYWRFTNMETKKIRDMKPNLTNNECIKIADEKWKIYEANVTKYFVLYNPQIWNFEMEHIFTLTDLYNLNSSIYNYNCNVCLRIIRDIDVNYNDVKKSFKLVRCVRPHHRKIPIESSGSEDSDVTIDNGYDLGINILPDLGIDDLSDIEIDVD